MFRGHASACMMLLEMRERGDQPVDLTRQPDQVAVQDAEVARSVVDGSERECQPGGCAWDGIVDSLLFGGEEGALALLGPVVQEEGAGEFVDEGVGNLRLRTPVFGEDLVVPAEGFGILGSLQEVARVETVSAPVACGASFALWGHGATGTGAIAAGGFGP